MNKIFNLSRIYFNKLIIFFLFVCSISSVVYFFQKNEILLYNDSRGHLDIARRVVDSLTPGFVQLGSVWLPLYQTLELPFIWNNFLWHSGLAGSIISALSYIGAGFYIFKIISKLTKSTFASVFGLIIFALNPNLLYLQSVPLDEVLTLFMINASIYYILDWSKSNNISRLLLAAMFAFLGSLVRYEVWFLIVFEVLYIFLVSIKGKPTTKNLREAESYTVLFSILAFFGIFLWFLYNFLIWNNALYFLNGQYSANSQQVSYAKNGILLTKHNILLSLEVYSSDIAENVGYIFSSLGCLSLLYFIFKKGESLYQKYFYIMIFAPAIFDLVSLFLGVIVIYTKHFPYPGSSNIVFNVRYGIMGLTPIVILVASMFAVIEKRFNFKYLLYIFAFLLIIAEGLIFYQTRPVSVIADGLNGISAFGKGNKNLPTVIGNKCNRGLTLISAASNDPLMFASGLPMKAFIHEGSGIYWNRAISSPKSEASCVVFSKADDIYNKFIKNPQILDDYHIIYKSKDAWVYKRK